MVTALGQDAGSGYHPLFPLTLKPSLWEDLHTGGMCEQGQFAFQGRELSNSLTCCYTSTHNSGVQHRLVVPSPFSVHVHARDIKGPSVSD